MIETFFNPQIIEQIWPIVLAGLANTILLSLIVVPLCCQSKATAAAAETPRPNHAGRWAAFLPAPASDMTVHTRHAASGANGMVQAKFQAKFWSIVRFVASDW